VNVATDWFRFRKLLLRPALISCHFDYAYEEFTTAMQERLSYLPMTIASISRPVKRFLLKMATRHGHLSSISIQDIDDYLGEGRREGWRPRTVVSQCQALRAFLRYAESQGWCRSGLARTVRNPRVKARDWVVTGPSWEDVRRTIDTLKDSNSSQCRTKAIFLLGSIYGLRNSEITNLTLDDFDWYNETFVVKRAKRGPLQQFPIQYEVGEAILSYLKTVRPRCICRSLFVTLLPPHRPLVNLAPLVRKRLIEAGIISQTYGTHSLRHACATELLRKGTSLRNIADFLGHRDIRSVSIYAKFDLRLLCKVADFSLASVL
jgi:site-specific recombinase XerD